MNVIGNMTVSECHEHMARGVTPVVECLVVNDRKEVLLSKRATEPFKGMWHLPGGLIHVGERIVDAVKRVVLEECGLQASSTKIIALHNMIDEDPRGHLIQIVTFSKGRNQGIKKTEKSLEAKFCSFESLPEKRLIIENHRRILKIYGNLVWAKRSF